MKPNAPNRAFEPLEDRRLLATGTFALASGDIGVAREVDVIPLTIAAARFTLPGGRVVVGVEVHAAGAGNPLDPGKIKLVPAVRANRVASLVSRIDEGTQNNASFLLARVLPGDYALQVRAEGATRGAYDVEIFLAGDVNNDFQVTRT